MRLLQRHPLIDLLRLVAWNPQFCCIPLHALDTINEFIHIFTVPFLARVLTLLQVMIQYPHEYHAYMKDIKVVSSNACITSLFSSVFIHPDIVVANMSVLNNDLYYFLNESSLKEQKYILCLFSLLAPNSDSRLANFGRVQDRQDSIQSKIYGKGGGSNAVCDDDDDVNTNDHDMRTKYKGSSKSLFVENSLSKVCTIVCYNIFLIQLTICFIIYNYMI